MSFDLRHYFFLAIVLVLVAFAFGDWVVFLVAFLALAAMRVLLIK